MYQQMAQMFAYGQPNARMWVVGLEEHCESEIDLTERIAIRTAQPVEYFDLEAFHRLLGQGMPALNRVPVWQNTLAIYRGVYNLPTQLGRLDASASDVLLAEILPFPRPQHNQWPPAYHAEFPTPEDYIEFALPSMSERLLLKVAEHPPEVVVLHGKGSPNRWVDLHPEMRPNWEKFVYGSRRNESLKWRLHEGTLWLRTNNLVNNGHIRFDAPQLNAVTELITQRRISRC